MGESKRMPAASVSRTGSHLLVVPAPSHRTIEADTVGLSLTSTPFRPGELPVLWWAQLCTAEREIVAQRAAEDRVPVALWLRTAVEASRVVVEIASATGASVDAVTAALDTAAVDGNVLGHIEPTRGALDRYADLLVRGERAGGVDSEVVVRLSEEMAGAWRRAAIATRTLMPAWIAARLTDAPQACVAWEIAAARTCRTLAEWAYASTLRSMTASSA
jgi:hypothetical protein